MTLQKHDFGRMFLASFGFHALVILLFLLKNMSPEMLAPKAVAIEIGGEPVMSSGASRGGGYSAPAANPDDAVSRFFSENLPFAPNEKINTSTPSQSYENVKKQKQVDLEKALQESSDQEKSSPHGRSSDNSFLNEKDLTGVKNFKGFDSGTGNGGNPGGSGAGKGSGGVDSDIDMDNAGRGITYTPPKPSYPQWALDQNVQGNVQVRIYIDKDGFVVGADVVQSSGNSRLDVLAKNYALNYRFEPARQDREETARVRVDFKIK